MPAHKKQIAPELIAEAKRLYERTLTSQRNIAAMLGIAFSTLNERIDEWGWTRRPKAREAMDLVPIVRGAAAVSATPGTADRLQCRTGVAAAAHCARGAHPDCGGA